MESYGFFNGDTEYGQDEFNRYFKNIYEDGLSRGSNGSLTLSASLSGESVILTPGFAIMQGFFITTTATRPYRSLVIAPTK